MANEFLGFKVKKVPPPLVSLFILFVLLATRLHGQGGGNQFCGEIVKNTGSFSSGSDTAFFDRFGNTYSAAELDAFYYPDDTFLEDCNSGIFTLQFGVLGGAAAWTTEEMMTVCSVFQYLSGLVASSQPASGIVIRVTKDPNCASDAAASPIWDSDCGIANSVIFDHIVSGASNYPQGFISGIICIRPTTNWHTLADDCSPTNPCMGSSEVDLYTAMLHEALHVLGFASRIGLTGGPLGGGLYSRWDRFLRSSNQNAYLIRPQSSTSCCDRHVFDAQSFSNMPTDLSGDCSMNVFFFDGSANVAEVNNDVIVPNLDGQMANKLSHLDNTCTSGANFVMNPELLPGTTNRALSTAELAILCHLGYAGSACSNSCAIVANNDGPYTLILSQGTSMTITAAQVLANDAHPQNPTIAPCGNDPGITIGFSNNIFTVTGSQEGMFTFCYTVSGCQGWCDEAEVTVIVRQQTIPLNCQNTDCNLVCFGNFEEILPIFNSYYTQTGLDISNFIGMPNSAIDEPDPVAEIDKGNNIVVVTNWSTPANINNAAREFITIPLAEPIQPGCTATINFDAASIIPAGNPTNPTIQVYGLTGYPCPLINVPNCATDPFPICGGVMGYCLTSTTCPNSVFGCVLPVDPDAIITTGSPNIAQNLDFAHFSLTWENTSNQDITHLIFFTSTVSGTIPSASRILVPIDKVEVYSDCSSHLTLDVAPNPLELCIGGVPTATSVSVQLTGDGTTPVTVNLQAGPLPLGLSFSGGDFNSSGEAQVTLTPNGPAETLTLSLVAGSNWTPGATIKVPIVAASASGNFCFDSAQDGATLEVVLLDCGEVLCDCTLGYTVTGTTILSTSSLPQNGLSSTCLAVAGMLTIDADYTIDASTIRMQPGSSIVVNPGVTLNITGGNIHGCVQLWKGISVHGTLNLKGVTVEDAEYAVHLKPGAKVSLIANTFRKNYTSVYYNENSGTYPVFTAFHTNVVHCENLNLLPPYPGQQTQSGTKSYAAVDLSFLAGVNIGDGKPAKLNHFHHLQNGVLMHGAVVTVRSTKFSHIPVNDEYALRGHGIHAVRSTLVQSGLGLETSNPTFQNVARGIWATTGSNIDARNSVYSKVLTGIRASHSSRVNIQNNRIFCDNIGIELYQNQGASELTCKTNQIWLDYESGDMFGKSIGIWVNDLPVNTSKVVKNILNNIIYTAGPNTGIRLFSATRYQLHGNSVTFSNPNAVSGISVAGSQDCMLSCNEVSGAGAGGSIDPDDQSNNSFNIAQTTGTTYRCNSSTNTRSGFLFSGFCGSSASYAPEFRGNTFNTAHRLGLWMTNSASFGAFGPDGAQAHKGNQWYGTYSGGTRALHQGDPFFVNLSTFVIHTTSLPWYPENWVANGPWFVTDIGSPNPCNPSTECLAPAWIVREGDEIGEFGRRVAEDSLLLPEIYAGGLRWEMRQALYGKIADTPAIAEQDEALDDFYQQNQNSALGRFTHTARAMAAVAEIADSTLVALEAGYAGIHAKLDTLVLLEQGLSDDPTPAQLDSLATLKQALGSAIVALHQTRSTLLAGRQDDLNDAAATLVIVNNSTVTAAVVEENRRTVNMVALNKVVRGSTQFTAIERTVLQEVAMQCPLVGGNAVYEARSILAYTGEIPEYDDAVLCDSATLAEERALPQAVQFSPRDEGYQFSAVPNPANDYLRIQYAAPAEAADMEVQLVSPTGAIAIDIRLAEPQGARQIGLSHLPAGLYYLHFVANGMVISVQKVVVIH